MMNAIAKVLFVADGVGGLHPLQVTFARYLFAAGILIPFGLSRLRLPSGPSVAPYAIRVLAGYLGVVLMFFAIKELRLSDATAIGFTSPFFAIAASGVILKERAGYRRWLSAVVGFIGVLIITQPTGQSFEPAALIALTAAIAMGVEIVGVKWLSVVDKSVTVILISNILAVPLGAAAAIPVWVWPSAAQWLILLAIGAVAAIGQQCVLRGARLGDASFIAPFFYFSLVFSTFLGAVIFDERPPLSTIIGSIIIFAGVLFSAGLRVTPMKPRASLGRKPFKSDGQGETNAPS